jgi:hypothetical protein
MPTSAGPTPRYVNSMQKRICRAEQAIANKAAKSRQEQFLKQQRKQSTKRQWEAAELRNPREDTFQHGSKGKGRCREDESAVPQQTRDFEEMLRQQEAEALRREQEAEAFQREQEAEELRREQEAEVFRREQEVEELRREQEYTFRRRSHRKTACSLDGKQEERAAEKRQRVSLPCLYSLFR